MRNEGGLELDKRQKVGRDGLEVDLTKVGGYLAEGFRGGEESG